MGPSVDVMGGHALCIAAVIGGVTADQRAKWGVPQHLYVPARCEEGVEVVSQLLPVEFPVSDRGRRVTDARKRSWCAGRLHPDRCCAQRGDRMLRVAG